MKSRLLLTPEQKPGEWTDDRAWHEFKNGDMEAFGLLYQRYFDVLLIAGLKINHNKAMTKDCIQDLFTELWVNRQNLAYPESVKAYLTSSIQRKVIRSQKRVAVRGQEGLHNLMSEIVVSREDQIISQDDSERKQRLVKAAIQSLTRRQQEAIQMKFYSGLTYNEIGEIMEISVDSIYNLISKAIDGIQREVTRLESKSGKVSAFSFTKAMQN